MPYNPFFYRLPGWQDRRATMNSYDGQPDPEHSAKIDPRMLTNKGGAPPSDNDYTLIDPPNGPPVTVEPMPNHYDERNKGPWGNHVLADPVNQYHPTPIIFHILRQLLQRRSM